MNLIYTSGKIPFPGDSEDSAARIHPNRRTSRRNPDAITSPASQPRTFSDDSIEGGEMRHEIRREWCKGCGICVAFCPKKALSQDKDGKAVQNPDLCVYCGICERYCPDLAIEVDNAKSGEGEKQ